MARPNAGDDSNPRSGEGGPHRTAAQFAADPAFTGTYATRQRAKALAILSTMKTDPEALTVSSAAPTVSVTLGASTTSISSGVKISPAFVPGSTTVYDVDNDPHFSYPGVAAGKLNVTASDCAYPDLFPAGASQAARWRPLISMIHTGQVIEFGIRSPSATLIYRLWVNGQPVTLAMNSTAVTSPSRNVIKVDFGSVGTRQIDLEVDTPQFNCAFIEPTATLRRRTVRRFRFAALGDSVTAGANTGGGGASFYDTWVRYSANYFGADWWNLGIGGTGFINIGGNAGGDYTTRIADATAANPDVLVIFGSYNDAATYNQTQIQAAALACFQAAQAALPNTILIAAGCWLTGTGTAAPTIVAADNGVKAAAAAAGIPFISLVDTTGLAATAPAWAATTVYVAGQQVLQNGWVQTCVTNHTSTGSFDQTKFKAASFIYGTGKTTATTGDGNGDVFISSDGIHPTVAGHAALGYFFADRIEQALRTLANAA